MKLVIVGEAPGRDPIVDRPSLALTGDSGRRLCAIAGWDWLDYLRHTDRRNLFYVPKVTWNRWDARKSAEEMLPTLDGRRVILLGTKVAEAFGQRDAPNYMWFGRRWPQYDIEVGFVPHPSGRNRLWNSRDEQERARRFLQDLLG